MFCVVAAVTYHNAVEATTRMVWRTSPQLWNSEHSKNYILRYFIYILAIFLSPISALSSPTKLHRLLASVSILQKCHTVDLHRLSADAVPLVCKSVRVQTCTPNIYLWYWILLLVSHSIRWAAAESRNKGSRLTFGIYICSWDDDDGVAGCCAVHTPRTNYFPLCSEVLIVWMLFLICWHLCALFFFFGCVISTCLALKWRRRRKAGASSKSTTLNIKNSVVRQVESQSHSFTWNEFQFICRNRFRRRHGPGLVLLN